MQESLPPVVVGWFVPTLTRKEKARPKCFVAPSVFAKVIPFAPTYPRSRWMVCADAPPKNPHRKSNQ
jgi:hypothetical protein